LPKRQHAPAADHAETPGAAVRPFWSGTITFGLVSIPVELLSAVRQRQTALKLIDKEGHALGRQFRCSKEDKRLDNDDLVRGYETDSGKIIEISDREFESVAPEMSSDIELRNFVPLEQISPMYFQKPYFLAPAGKSAKAYHLLAATMAKTGRVGIGSFVMRGHEYLVAIVADNGVLRVDTLRYADEIRTPDTIGLPKQPKSAGRKAAAFARQIEELTRKSIDVGELRDEEAAQLQALVTKREKDRDNVIERSGLEEADGEAGTGAQVIDLMAVLRKSLSKSAVVTNAEGAQPISLAERRAQRDARAVAKTPRKAAKKKARAKRKTRKAKASR
jgi:DNA end-binding protein Ku